MEVAEDMGNESRVSLQGVTVYIQNKNEPLLIKVIVPEWQD